MPVQLHGAEHCVSEWGLSSGKAYADPFNEIEVDVVVEDGGGRTWRVPAHWAGDQEWRVRFAPPAAGAYSWRSACSDESNSDLHGRQGTLQAGPYQGCNPLLLHGPLRVSADRKHLEHVDGTPFFWLADTWWMALCKRLHWPEEFDLLAADRVAKGFSVIQIVAGLYPDMPAFDERGFNEAGHPWEPEYARIRPAYFDQADLRLRHLVSVGLAPCIVACWGYHLPWLGIDKMKQHWRNLIARYGAYPVVWCLAGEGAMPYYLAEDKAAARAEQIAGWTELGRYVRATDPFHNPITIHPTDSARNQVQDDTVLDLDMLQTGHSGWDSVPNTLEKIRASVAREPHMPVIESEVNYEGILEASRQEMQRYLFWSTMLSGAAGFTYGANGIWQLNRAEQPYGPSPHGASWGDTPWTEAYRLPGSEQVGLGKRFLTRYPWWRLEPHQDWVEPAADPQNPMQPFAAGIPERLRIIYLPRPVFPWGRGGVFVTQLEPGIRYRAYYFGPKEGQEVDLGEVAATDGRWQLPLTPVMQDWVLVLERITR
jgi:hypothetical protein